MPAASHRLRIALVGLFALLLAGCKVDLHTNLSEDEANEIVAILLESGIRAEKTATGEDKVSVRIDDSDMLAAVNLLKHSGYPKKQRDSIGTIFKKTGIMSSPFEERVRFIYALSQELSETLGEIDGVNTARVHIVLPDTPELGATVMPSSAAVFIKHRAGLDLDFLTPQIKRLVSNAIEGMSYDKVSVVLIEAERSDNIHHANASENITLAGFSLPYQGQDVATALFLALVVMVVLVIAAGGAGAFFFLRTRRKVRTASHDAPEIEPA
jgi:type III secretion protein J